MCRVARKQRKQQAVGGGIAKYQAIGRIAMLADEIDKRGQITRKQQTSPILPTSSRDHFMWPSIGANATTPVECLKAKPGCEHHPDRVIPSQAHSRANSAARKTE